MNQTVRWTAIYGALTAAMAVLVAIAGHALSRPAPVPGGDPEFADAPSTRRLAWFDRDGTMRIIPTPPRGYAYPRLAPDGRSAAIDIRDAGHGLWLWHVGSASLTALSIGRVSDIAPVWSRAGDRLIFARGRGVAPGLLALTPATGAIVALPMQSNSLPLPSAITPDDRRVLATVSAASGFDIVAVDISSRDGGVTPLVAAAADDLNPDVSPDGRWLAYQSRASGQFEIWLQPLTGGAAAQLTDEGGTRPVWTRGGRELIYLTNDGVVMAMAVAGGSTGDLPAVSRPRVLFQANLYRELVGRTFDVTADGLHVLAVVEP